METISTVGDKVRELRKARGWTQATLGERSGVTAQTVWLLETHKLEDVKLSTLEGIAGALEVSLTDLLA